MTHNSCILHTKAGYNYHICFDFHVVIKTHGIHGLEVIHEELDWAIVKWQNMAVHKYKITKIAKSINLQNIHPAKFKGYMVLRTCVATQKQVHTHY